MIYTKRLLHFKTRPRPFKTIVMDKKLKEQILKYLSNAKEVNELTEQVLAIKATRKDLKIECNELAVQIMNAIESTGGGMSAHNGPLSFYANGQAYLFSIEMVSGSRELVIEKIQELTK